MNVIVYIIVTASLCTFLSADIRAVLEKSDTCKDNVCPKDDGAIKYTEIDDNEEPITFTAPYDLNENQFFKIFNEEKIENISPQNKEIIHTEHTNLQKSFNKSFNNFSFKTSENETKQFYNTTDAYKEFSFEEKETTEISTEFNYTETTEKSTIKSNTTTTQTPTSSKNLFQNVTKGNDICFCDLTVDQCDINCCCDEDCTDNHWSVFTKCKDLNIEQNLNYCFKSDFIFENNTKHKMVQNKKGLFCIVKENLEIPSTYKTKEIITTLESFNKNLPKNWNFFLHKSMKRGAFEIKDYKFGSNIWIIDNSEIKPFSIPAQTIGLACTSQLNVKYLKDKTSICSHAHPQDEVECGNSKHTNVFHYFRQLRIISNPLLVNVSQKICKPEVCIGVSSYICQSSDKFPNCTKIPERASNFPKIGCWNTVPKIRYHIWHNGTEGIKKFEAYIWLRNVSNALQEHLLQTTEVKFTWVGSSTKIFQRSGNPGYLTGKPLLAGRKVYLTKNGTTDKKEAIQMSIDSKNWLSVLGSVRGLCSTKNRIPVNFRENVKHSCSLPLTKDNFARDKCVNLQNFIYSSLIGSNITNATSSNYFNKFVATFGNSKVEETGDWVQVLLDLFPIISNPVSFKPNYNNLICKNIVTHLYIDVVYSQIGSFTNPQAKVLGVSFRFGNHKDLIYYCNGPNCENSTTIQYIKLTSLVQFIDVTEPAVDAFAESLGLEAKLPHDFFYPFFSKGSAIQPLNLGIYILFRSVGSVMELRFALS